MAFWNRRGTAWAVTCAAVAVSVLFGSASSLGALRAEAEQLFTEGVSEEEPGIQYDLDWLLELSHNLLVVASRYLPETDPTLTALEDARAKLESASSPARKYGCAELLIASSSQLSYALSRLELDERDDRYRLSLMADIESRWLIIGRNTIYNERAAAFNEELNRFPANVLSRVTFVRPLELFAP